PETVRSIAPVLAPWHVTSVTSVERFSAGKKVISISSNDPGQMPSTSVIVHRSTFAPGERLFAVAFGVDASGEKVTPGGPVHIPVSPGAGVLAERGKLFTLQTVPNSAPASAFVASATLMSSVVTQL